MLFDRPIFAVLLLFRQDVVLPVYLHCAGGEVSDWNAEFSLQYE
jgi:hypothetical protein